MHCPPPGRRDKDAELPYSAVAKHCPDITRGTLQPFPSQTSLSLGPSSLKGSSTHQPTHSSAAIIQRMSQVSSSSSDKAACHIPGREERGQSPEQAWCRGKHQVWALKGLIHLLYPGSKQPLSCTQGTAGVLAAANSWGQCVAPHHRNTPGREAAPIQALQGVLGAEG